MIQRIVFSIIVSLLIAAASAVRLLVPQIPIVVQGALVIGLIAILVILLRHLAGEDRRFVLSITLTVAVVLLVIGVVEGTKSGWSGLAPGLTGLALTVLTGYYNPPTSSEAMNQ